MSDNNSQQNDEQKNKISNFSILTNILTDPNYAMAQVRGSYSIMFPLMLVAISSALLMYYYYTVVDYKWFIDYMVETTAGELSKAEQDASRAAMSMMSQNAMGIVSFISVLVIVPIMYVVQSVYFVIMSNIYGDGFEFKHWYSFISWSALPNVLSVIASFVYLATTNNGQIPPDAINQLSLNELIFGLEPSKGLGKLLSTLHLAQFWSFAVMTVGYSQWTKKSIGKSAGIVLTPYIIFYIGWFLFI